MLAGARLENGDTSATVQFPSCTVRLFSPSKCLYLSLSRGFIVQARDSSGKREGGRDCRLFLFHYYCAERDGVAKPLGE